MKYPLILLLAVSMSANAGPFDIPPGIYQVGNAPTALGGHIELTNQACGQGGGWYHVFDANNRKVDAGCWYVGTKHRIIYDTGFWPMCAFWWNPRFSDVRKKMTEICRNER